MGRPPGLGQYGDTFGADSAARWPAPPGVPAIDRRVAAARARPFRRERKKLRRNVVQSVEMATASQTDPDVEAFIRVTGGGAGKYDNGYFNQTERCSRPSALSENQGLGFGRIKFKQDEQDPKPYIRVPWHTKEGMSTDSRLLLHFIESVWGLERPNLVVSITGGAMDTLTNSDDLQHVLLDLMKFARGTSAWLTTGGTHGGIMKLIGESGRQVRNLLLPPGQKSMLHNRVGAGLASSSTELCPSPSAREREPPCSPVHRCAHELSPPPAAALPRFRSVCNNTYTNMQTVLDDVCV